MSTLAAQVKLEFYWYGTNSFYGSDSVFIYLL